MLDKHEISVGCLVTHLGLILGLALLVLSEVLDVDDLARWGLTSLGLACTYSIHRSLAAKDARLLNAFSLGRDYERTRDLTAVR